MEHGNAAFVFAMALGAGVAAQVVARHVRVPSIVLLLAAGVLLGPDGLGMVVPESLGDGLFQLVRLAVAVILFEGGLNLELSRLRRESAPLRRLLSTGAAVTALGAAAAARVFMDWPWSIALLFGTLVVVTGPTVIRPLLRVVPLRPRLATILEAEGVLIDPIGAILAAVTLEVIIGASLDSFAEGIGSLLTSLLFGGAAGIAFGLGLGWLLRQGRVIPEDLENIVTLGSVLVIYELCEAVRPESGILAVTLAGVATGNLARRVGRRLGEFEENLTVALIGILFVLLAADVRLAEVRALGIGGLATVGVLMFLVRPANVLASTVGSELDLRERAFLSWVAPRGVVAAAIASLFAAVMDSSGLDGGREFRALVFLTIAATVVFQGGTAPLVGRLLGVRAPGRENLVILGAEEFGFALAEALDDGRGQVLFVDSSPGHCRMAEERGFGVVYGNALQHRTLVRARMEQARAVLGLTANDEVNALFAREAHDDFDVPETYVALSSEAGTVGSRILEKQESRVLFDGPKEVERWNVRFRHGQAEVRRLRFTGVPEAPAPAEAPPNGLRRARVDSFAILAVERGARRLPMHPGLEPRSDDVAWVAIHGDERDAALETLASLGWQLLPDASEPTAADAG